ncbi:MAG: ABC transporter permease, partial [Acidimicrobiia bacterium]
IVFLFSFTSFGTVLILGGPRDATIEVEIYRQATALFDLGVAAALAVVQLVAVTAALAVYGRFQRRRSMPGLLTVASGRRASTPGGRAAVAVTLAGGLAVVGFPIWYLVRAALDTAGGFGFTWFARLGSHRDLVVDPAQAIGNSLLYAAVALTTTLVVGGLISIVVSRRESRSVGWFDTLVMLPLGTSAVTLGFGFIIALDRPFDLRGTWVLVPLAHALVAIPLFTRVVVPVLKSIDPLQRDAAAALGASPWQVRRLVDFPMARRAVAVGAALAIAVSLGEFGATAFVARPNAPTIPIAIFRFLSQPGAVSLGTAAAMSVVLLLVTGAVVAAVDRTGEIGTF